jgi:hypothetical protein
MSSDDGRLKVVLPALDAGEVRLTFNLIDADTLALVRTAACEEEITVPAGKYLLSSLLPTGERSLGIAEVAAGELAEAELIPVEEPTAEAVQATKERAPEGPGELESLGVPRDAAPREAPQATAWFVRWLIQKGRKIDQARGLNVSLASDAGPDGGTELIVRAPRVNGVLFAQLARPDEIPLNVALPINGRTNSTSCRLTVSSGAPLTAVVSLFESPQADAVARYLHSGALQEAANLVADLAAQAEKLLRDKQADPFGAALGGYALLRLHELARLHDWAQNLADWFPWLPDGAIVAGEQAALSGDHARAVTNFCEAARRGLPVYADGFSMLVSRLREYGQPDDPPPGVAGKLVAEAADHAKRLAPLTPTVDFARIMLALPGARLEDPANSQEPIGAPSAADGWQRFSPSAGAFES